MYKFKEFVLLKEAMASGVHPLKRWGDNPMSKFNTTDNTLRQFLLHAIDEVTPIVDNWTKTDEARKRVIDTSIKTIIDFIKSGNSDPSYLNSSLNALNGQTAPPETKTAFNIIANSLRAFNSSKRHDQKNLGRFLRQLNKDTATLGIDFSEKADELHQLHQNHQQNPIQPQHITSTVKGLAHAAKTDPSIHPILADALQDADYNNDEVLKHLRTNSNPWWIKHNIVNPLTQ